MPLYNYKCVKCNIIVEKFQHKPSKDVLECEKCGSKEFDKVFGIVFGKIWLNAKDTMSNVIAPEVQRIEGNLSKGNDKAFLDMAGD